MIRTLLAAVLALTLSACDQKPALKPPPPESPQQGRVNPLTGQVVTAEGRPAVLAKPLRVGATPLPHAELIRAVLPELAAQGVSIELTTTSDWNLPNRMVGRGDLDVNFFQTEPYLWRWRAAHVEQLVVVGRVHVEPMGIWGRKGLTRSDLGQVKPGGLVALPADPSNLGRALILLQSTGLIEVDHALGLDVGLADIVKNPKKLKFQSMAAEKVASLAGTAELAAVNGNYALEKKLARADALAMETADSAFPNVLVTRQEQAQDPRVAALVKALRGPTAQRVLKEKFADSAIFAVEEPAALRLSETAR